MAIQRVSDLEQFKWDGSDVDLSTFIASDEYKYSCIEVSKNINGSEHSQFQSMRMDLSDLNLYLEYDVLSGDIDFAGNKNFQNHVTISGGACIYNHLNVGEEESPAYDFIVYANKVLIDARQSMDFKSASELTLSSNNGMQLFDPTQIDISSGRVFIRATNNLDLTAATTSCYSTSLIALDLPCNSDGSNTTLSGKADKVQFNVGTDDGKFSISSPAGYILSVDKDNVVYFEKRIHAMALSACWADLAECYIADKPYEPGTLVKFGGEQELTVADDEANAVVTTKPGFILNSSLEASAEGQFPVAVALVGRTPVRVKGAVKKFQNLMLLGDGVAAASDGSKPTVAKALENKDSDEVGLVNCVVSLKL